MQDILLSKIAANATETTWSQAYSTINFYVVVSVRVENLPEVSIAQTGKDVLERLQREFFSLDQKDLKNIKTAVTNVTATTPSDIALSLVLATISDGILYLVIAHGGITLIKRGEKIGVIAEGKEGAVTGFSGHLKPHDILVLQTKGFSHKISPAQLSSFLESDSVTETAEGIIPHLHENSTGDEAALILQYASTTPPEEEKKHSSLPESPLAPEEEPPASIAPTEQFSPVMPSPKKFQLPHLRLTKTTVLIGIVVTLLLLFLGGIFWHNFQKKSVSAQKDLQAVLAPSQQDYDDAVALMSLNKPLALENLKDAQARLLSAKSSFSAGSKETQQIDELLSKINSKLDEAGGSSSIKNLKALFDASSVKELTTLTVVSFHENALIVASPQGNIAEISSTGSLSTLYPAKISGLASITHDGSFIYAAGDNTIHRIDRKNKKSQEIVSDTTDSSAVGGLHPYMSNLYVLDKGKKSILKFAGSSYDESAYFKTEPSFTSAPYSFAIDGAVWVAEQSGLIHKFNKGVEEQFSVKGIPDSIGPSPIIYTDIDYTNLYILDPQKSRIIVIGKDGVLKNQYSDSTLKSASALAVNETSKTGYVVIGAKLYSFDL